MNEQAKIFLTRREFLERAAGLGLSASAIALLNGCGMLPTPTPTPARIALVGFLSSNSLGSPSGSAAGSAYDLELHEQGFIQGQNLKSENRRPDPKSFPELAAELVALKPDVLVGFSTPAVLALKQATNSIPIVFGGIDDPVAAGLVASLAHPGGNVTGTANFATKLHGKRLELLKESFPRISRVGIFWNGGDAGNAITWSEIQTSARELNLQVVSIDIRSPAEFDSQVEAALRERPDALINVGEMTTGSLQPYILGFASKNRLPAMYDRRTFVDSGGLMSYGPNFADLYRGAAVYVAKILRGAKPSDLPVEQPTKFEFVINLNTANRLGLTISQSVLAQATEVIQ